MSQEQNQRQVNGPNVVGKFNEQKTKFDKPKMEFDKCRNLIERVIDDCKKKAAASDDSLIALESTSTHTLLAIKNVGSHDFDQRVTNTMNGLSHQAAEALTSPENKQPKQITLPQTTIELIDQSGVLADKKDKNGIPLTTAADMPITDILNILYEGITQNVLYSEQTRATAARDMANNQEFDKDFSQSLGIAPPPFIRKRQFKAL